jgi:hypothetical protein
MSGASEVVAALQEAVAATAQSVGSAGRNFTKAVQAVSQSDDVILTLQAMVDLVVATRDLHKAADAAVERVQTALAEQMEMSGATTITAQHQSAHLARKPAFLNIADEALIPRNFYVQPEPQLDKRALKSALTDGQEIPGVSLAIPNAMSLVIRARKE